MSKEHAPVVRDDKKSMTNESVRTKEEDNRIADFYTDRLCFLWQQYNRAIGFGILLSGVTLIGLFSIVLSPQTRELIKSVCANGNGGCVNPLFLKMAVVSLFVSTISFVCCRWCSQIIMERHIYGGAEDALYYFEKILENETFLPSALKPKQYTPKSFGGRKRFLKIIGNLNEWSKWSGVVFASIGLIATFCYLSPLLAI